MNFFTRERRFLFLAAVMAIVIPGISYAQLDLKGKAVETLTNGVMKELDKKFVEMVAKEALSAAVKENIVKNLSEMSRPIVKDIIDGATSGKLPNVATVVTSVLNQVTPRLQELLAASLRGDAVGSLAQTGGQPLTAAGVQPAVASNIPAIPSVDIRDIQGVTFPSIGSTPVTTITETAQYKGIISWSPAVSGTFAINTQYIATITLTPKTGFSFDGVAANFFNVSGATSVRNNAGSGVITAVFPGVMTINSTTITGVAAPEPGRYPVTAISGSSQYSGTVTWSPEVKGTFAPTTRYTATITLTPRNGYTLLGINDNNFTVAGAESSSNNANSGIITAIFPPTGEIKALHTEDNNLWSIGASLGTSFAAPLFISTLRGTLSPFNGSFIDLGLDAGFGINVEDVEYFSLYPYVNYALYVPFTRLSNEKRGGWYAGAGVGVMFANYTFAASGSILDTVFAGNIVFGVYIFDMFDISYTIRTNFTSANSKLSFGYVYRFK